MNIILGLIMTLLVTPLVDDTPFYGNVSTAEKYKLKQEERLSKAKVLLEKISSSNGKRTIQNTLAPFDEILILINAAGSQSGLLENVHPDSTIRKMSEEFSQKVSTFASELSLNRLVYEALNSIDISEADETTKFFLQKTLRDFRLAGVDKDEASRKKIKELRDELVLISQDFARNIREDVRFVFANNISELDGLPKDFIDLHKPENDGKVKITINYPDAVPVFTYAKNEDLRKKLYMEFNNRAYPKNISVLDKLISKRGELASVVGFQNYAAYVTADKMVASEKNASQFIEKIAAASLEKSKKDYQQLLSRKKSDVSNATEIFPWESGYYSELVRKSDYNFDGQKVRPYFSYNRVKQGVLDITSKLFGVTYKQNKDALVWHPSVECWEVFENGKMTGRFYLDMHPRENKYNHAAQFDIRAGVKNNPDRLTAGQIPEAALICNFPGGVENDPGLMEHSDVETFFHEFGHLLHSIFGGSQKWAGITGISTEWDFVEAPSQLLEEWAWDAKTLQTFAKHYQTNEPISTELVNQMRRASEFGKGLQVRQQMYYAKLSLSCYDRNPSEVNTNELIKNLREKYTPYKHVDGTHMQTSFGHLDGYSAIYYTYMWSLVIAKDFISIFNEENMMEPSVAKKYRENILNPGGSLPADKLVKNFLGRNFNFDGWKQWLEKE